MPRYSQLDLNNTVNDATVSNWLLRPLEQSEDELKKNPTDNTGDPGHNLNSHRLTEEQEAPWQTNDSYLAQEGSPPSSSGNIPNVGNEFINSNTLTPGMTGVFRDLATALFGRAGRNARFTSGYGNRMHPVLHKTRFHDGIDIGVASGTPLYTLRDGTITFAGQGRPWSGFGNCVVVQSGNCQIFYAHLQSVSVSPGESVSTGKLIGYTGNTGMSTGSHLHLGVHVTNLDGKKSYTTKANPLSILGISKP